jgi:hypothetical protein
MNGMTMSPELAAYPPSPNATANASPTPTPPFAVANAYKNPLTPMFMPRR